ncbi:hypothetical protein SETIT_2G107400v2 [Setaria italica]|uniref:Reverse transcriptase zinc-binding domain-containing protein n=1 Tax=Setaria italica TaxID=4555 RepID=A0A368PXB2_SETIT|nr:hypothetical protein SETIT_2G107400v2 [Setaria italica]
MKPFSTSSVLVSSLGNSGFNYFAVLDSRILHLNHLSTGFFDWWQQAGSTLDKGTKRGFNSLVMLGAWILWKERNDIVFNGASPRMKRVLLLAQEEVVLWKLVGAKAFCVS